MNRDTKTLAAAVVCAVGLYWVGDHPVEQPPAPATEEAAPQSKQADVAPKPTKTDESTQVAEQPSDEAQVAPESVQLAFEPPFPDRVEMFQAPKRQGKGRIRAQGQSETSVELLGFVNVDKQRVALAIDGFVTMAAEGEEQYGIEVISIQPPSVVLQRGRQRWQASFEN